MRREEAEKLIGKTFKVWTAMNGEYVGTLVEVIPRRPWRAKVKVTGVLRSACVWDITRQKPRRGFRPGDVIEVGGVNVEQTDATGGTYLAALEDALKFAEETLASPTVIEKYKFGLVPTIKNLKSCIEEERKAVENQNDSPAAVHE